MSLKQTITEAIKVAVLQKDASTRDVLRVVLGEVQTQESRTGKAASDEDVIRVMRKQYEGVLEMLKHLRQKGETYSAQTNELVILDTYLPKQAGKEDLLRFIEESGLLPQIMEAKEGQSTGIVMKALKTAGIAANGKIVGEVIKELRG
jgi:uncharacterized protein YqeY